MAGMRKRAVAAGDGDLGLGSRGEMAVRARKGSARGENGGRLGKASSSVGRSEGGRPVLGRGNGAKRGIPWHGLVRNEDKVAELGNLRAHRKNHRRMRR